MKKVLLSADSEISVFSVPDEVADHLQQYCMEFCCGWLHQSPDAEKYRVKRGGITVACYNEQDFIDYLNQYICAERSTLITTLANVYDEAQVPREYAGLPCFNF